MISFKLIIKTENNAVKPKKKNWRVQHEKFIKMVRSARGSEESIESPVTQKMETTHIAEDDDLVPCDHCGRKFHHITAERHIPHCKSMKEKDNRRKNNILGNEDMIKKSESLKKRTMYKPVLKTKPK
jgi:hypothetical protein